MIRFRSVPSRKSAVSGKYNPVLSAVPPAILIRQIKAVAEGDRRIRVLPLWIGRIVLVGEGIVSAWLPSASDIDKKTRFWSIVARPKALLPSRKGRRRIRPWPFFAIVGRVPPAPE